GKKGSEQREPRNFLRSRDPRSDYAGGASNSRDVGFPAVLSRASLKQLPEPASTSVSSFSVAVCHGHLPAVSGCGFDVHQKGRGKRLRDSNERPFPPQSSPHD